LDGLPKSWRSSKEVISVFSKSGLLPHTYKPCPIFVPLILRLDL